MNFLGLRNKKGIIVTLFITYIIILVVPIVANIVVYVKCSDIIIGEVSQYNTEILYNKAKNIDAIVENISNIVSGMSVNYYFRNAMEYSGKLTSDEMMNLNFYYKSALLNNISNNYISNVFVCFKKINYIFASSCNEPDNYYKTYYNDCFENTAKWREFLNNRYYGELVSIPTVGTNKNRTVYCYSVSRIGDDLHSANIFIELNTDFLESDTINDGYSNSFIMDGKKNIISGTCSNDFASLIADDVIKSDMNILKKQIEGKKYIVLKYYSSDSELYYVSCVDEKKYGNKIMLVRSIILGATLSSLLICAVIVYISTKKRVIPMNLFFDRLSNKFDIKVDKFNHIMNISDAVEKMISENKILYNRIPLGEKESKNLLMGKLLNGKVSSIDDILNRLKNFGIHFRYDNFVVLTIYYENYYINNEADEQKNHEDYELAQIVIENILTDILKNSFDSAFSHIDGYNVILISMDSAEKVDELYMLISEAQSIIENYFDIRYIVAFSEVYSGFENLPLCYREAKKCGEYRFLSYESILRYNTIDMAVNSKSKYPYDVLTEQKLMNVIKSGDYDEAHVILDKIIEKSIDELCFNMKLMKCLIFDILGTVLKAVDEMDAICNRSCIDRIEISERIDSCDTISAIKTEMEQILKECCEYILIFSENIQEQLSDRVKMYVSENYDDPNMTVSSVAENMNLSPNYLSYIFKKQSGTALWEYINLFRVNKAKEVLDGGDLNAEEIALKVGFSNMRSFSRIFNKYESISPGMYRKNSKNNKKYKEDYL